MSSSGSSKTAKIWLVAILRSTTGPGWPCRVSDWSGKRASRDKFVSGVVDQPKRSIGPGEESKFEFT